MSMAIAERVELDALKRQVADLSRCIDGLEAGRVVQTRLGAPRELLSLLHMLAERVGLLERRVPGREPFPAGDVMRWLEALERQCTGLAAVFPSEAGNEPRQRGDAFADLDARVTTLEQQSVRDTDGNTDAPGPDPAGFVARLEALEAAAIAAGVHSETVKEQWIASGDAATLEALTARVEALELHRANARPGNATRVAHGETLRAAIAAILHSEPKATGPLVIERLRSTHAGRLPSLRTVRWHLQALRGNGNTSALPKRLP